MNRLLLLPIAALAFSAEALAQRTPAECRQLADDRERLACYDSLTEIRAPESLTLPTPSPAAAAPAEAPKPAETVLVASIDGRRKNSLSEYWELRPEDKRGKFRFVSYAPNYFLPLHVTNRINAAPRALASDDPGLQKNYKKTEAKLQISLRTKLAEDVGLPNADLWFGYTQQALWQIWNSAESSPFRNTDYEPELIYVIPVAERFGQLPLGWQFSMVQLGMAHQSNGQSDPLSRSWNRVYAGVGLEKDQIKLMAKLWHRLAEGGDDDNPDLTSYRGRGEIQLSWPMGPATASVLYRSTFRNTSRGGWEFSWSRPIDSEHYKGLRWYAQFFSGYGESLIDYNFKQHSFGVGVALSQF